MSFQTQLEVVKDITAMHHDSSSIPPLFVCGTGRSGTWILYNCLARHADIHTFPREMRFLVDIDGLRTLVDALTVQFHPAYAAEALYRFEQLMGVFMTTPERAPYRGFDFETWLGGPYYRERLELFCGALVEHEFKGVNWQLQPASEGRLVAVARQLQGLRQQLVGEPVVPYRIALERDHLDVIRYFADRSALTELAGGFVGELFGHAARSNGRLTWCEKTPQTLLHLDFIWEILPQSVVVHMKRDPRGVLHSLRKQPWAPSELEGASLWLRNMYRRWFDLKQALDLSQRRYLEVSLESFCLQPQAVLEQICELAGLEYRFAELPHISLEKADYWKHEMSREDQQQATEILAPYIEWLGYEL
jgi:hypothetical protein